MNAFDRDFDGDWNGGFYPEVDNLSDDEYSAWAYSLIDEEDDVWLMEAYYDSLLDTYVPAYSGGSKPKYWWNFSRKTDKLEQSLRKRRRDADIRVPDIWKYGRDMPNTWEARGRGAMRKSDTPWDQYSSGNCKLRELQRAHRRKARQSIRTMKTAALVVSYDAQQFLSDHANF